MYWRTKTLRAISARSVAGIGWIESTAKARRFAIKISSLSRPASCSRSACTSLFAASASEGIRFKISTATGGRGAILWIEVGIATKGPAYQIRVGILRYGAVTGTAPLFMSGGGVSSGLLPCGRTLADVLLVIVAGAQHWHGVVHSTVLVGDIQFANQLGVDPLQMRC